MLSENFPKNLHPLGPNKDQGGGVSQKTQSQNKSVLDMPIQEEDSVDQINFNDPIAKTTTAASGESATIGKKQTENGYRGSSGEVADIAGAWLNFPGPIAEAAPAIEVAGPVKDGEFLSIPIPAPYNTEAEVSDRFGLFAKVRLSDLEISCSFTPFSELNVIQGEVQIPLNKTGRYQFALLPEEVMDVSYRETIIPAVDLAVATGSFDRGLLIQVKPKPSFFVISTGYIIDYTGNEDFTCPALAANVNGNQYSIIEEFRPQQDVPTWEGRIEDKKAWDLEYVAPDEQLREIAFCLYNELGALLEGNGMLQTAVPASSNRNLFATTIEPPLSAGLVGHLYATAADISGLPPTNTMTSPLGTYYFTELNVTNTEFAGGFQEDPSLNSWFSFEIQGFITIPQNCYCEFFLESDDATKLYIDDVLVIDNNLIQAVTAVTKKVSLDPGIYPIRIRYLQGPPIHVALRLMWKLTSPNDMFTVVSSEYFSH